MDKIDNCSNKMSEIRKILESLEEFLEIRLNELKITKEEMEKFNTSKDILKYMNSKLKKIKSVVETTKIVNPIVIDDNDGFEESSLYALPNGLIDVNRDILMKLIQILLNKVEGMKIRNIIGMTEIFYIWSKKRCFKLMFKYVKLPIRFVGGKSRFGHVDVAGERCVWNSDTDDWVMMDENMTAGLYSWVVEFEYPKTWGCGFGLLSKMHLHSKHNNNYLNGPVGSCFLALSKLYGDFISAGQKQNLISRVFPTFWKITIRLELDLNNRALHFFVNGQQILYCVTNIPSSVYFTINGTSDGQSFTVKSLERLSAPTVNTVLQCTA